MMIFGLYTMQRYKKKHSLFFLWYNTTGEILITRVLSNRNGPKMYGYSQVISL